MTDQIIPLFCSSKLDETTAFYREHLGFELAVELPGYCELERGAGGPRLAFMAPDGDRWMPDQAQSLIYCFSVDDADAEHARLAAAGVHILEAPADKPWGERGFSATDPNGIALYFGHALTAAPEGAAT